MRRSRRRDHHRGRMSPQASLAEAEAARRQQERRLEQEEPVRAGLDRLGEENNIAALLRVALGGRR